jgi:hypothetical protein
MATKVNTFNRAIMGPAATSYYFDFRAEIPENLRDRREGVERLDTEHMLVVAFAALIIEPDQPLTRSFIKHAVLVAMLGWRDALRH